MRDRLMELLDNVQNYGFVRPTKEEPSCAVVNKIIADYLLENGVIVPPCKVGVEIYRIFNGAVFGSWELERMDIYKDEMGFIDDGDNWIGFDDIGKTVFLTKEEAEQALKGGEG